MPHRLYSKTQAVLAKNYKFDGQISISAGDQEERVALSRSTQEPSVILDHALSLLGKALPMAVNQRLEPGLMLYLCQALGSCSSRRYN